MKPRPGFDDEFQIKPSTRPRSVRLIGWLMIMVATSGIAFSVAAGMDGIAKQRRSAFPTAQGRAPVARVDAHAAQTQHPFVVVAPPEIDLEMVVVAPADLDEAMVLSTDDRGQRPAPGAGLIPLPRGQRGQAPGTVSPPQRPAPTRPR